MRNYKRYEVWEESHELVKRNSDKDFTHFLDTSLGSANELEYCILLTNELGYLSPDMYKLLNAKIGAIRARLINLIRSIRGPKKP